MKKSLLAITLVFVATSVYAAGTPEKVCVKDAKGKETCKVVKVHKKLEGTKVPEKAPAKASEKAPAKAPAKVPEKK